MDCIEVQSRLSDYAEHDLMEREEEAIARHLQECGSCAKHQQTLGTTWDALGELPVEEPDPFAPRRFFARLDRRAVVSKFSSGLAAALVLIVLGAGWFMRSLSLQETSPPEVSVSRASSVSPEVELAAFGNIDTPALDDVNALLEENTP